MTKHLSPEQMNHVRNLLQQLFTESAQTWVDVVRYGTSQPLDESPGYPDDYEYGGWDSEADDEPDEPSTWDLGIPLDTDEEW